MYYCATYNTDGSVPDNGVIIITIIIIILGTSHIIRKVLQAET
jgi:hypothetical protein